MIRDELIYRARRLFAELRQGWEERHGDKGWWFDFTDEDAQRMGMLYVELEGAKELLLHKMLAKRVGMDGLGLDDLGYEACLNPELLDQVLGPPAIHGGSIHVVANNVVIGNNNTMEVNTSVLVQNLMDHLVKDGTVPEPEKKRWIEMLKDVGSHLTATATKVIIDKLLHV